MLVMQGSTRMQERVVLGRGRMCGADPGSDTVPSPFPASGSGAIIRIEEENSV